MMPDNTSSFKKQPAQLDESEQAVGAYDAGQRAAATDEKSAGASDKDSGAADQSERNGAADQPERDGAADKQAAPTLENLVPDLWFDREDFPDIEPEPALSTDESLDRFMTWAHECKMDLWSHQEDALLDLAAGDNVILGTPTGSGKSLVALGLMYMTISAGQHAYYTAPIKALVNQKFFDLARILGKDNVGMITGDTHVNTDAPVICATEEILAQKALQEGAQSDVAAVAMDEFHYFSDPDRGWAWQVPLLTLPHTQFLLMSATLGDTTQIADVLHKHTGHDVDEIFDVTRPVPLRYEYVDTNIEGTVELALRANDAPMYIVHTSQDAALSTAQALSSFGVADKDQRKKIRETLRGFSFNTAFGKILKRLLGTGVGVHHAGMLPRYRLLVEKLAQDGLLPVICGTDTLGVGINVPIHTVILMALTKFDGNKTRRLKSREFHQIAGRAGRAGFDSEGVVLAEAPEYAIENARIMAKAGNDPKKRRRAKKKQPPKDFVNWNKQTFEKLIASKPEKLKPRLTITHSMVLSEVMQGGNANARIRALISDSLQTPEEKVKLFERAQQIFDTLESEGVIKVHRVQKTHADTHGDEHDTRQADADGTGSDYAIEGSDNISYELTVDLPRDFALDEPLSPFMLAALELIDPESDTYALDVISVVESTLENPWQILRAQRRQARTRAMAQMRDDGVPYDERLERLQDVTYPMPLRHELFAAFDTYCEKVPWARDFELHPKSVVRDMVERAANFKEYIAAYNVAKNEGTLLRYLSDAYRVLSRTVPESKIDDQLADIIDWLGFMVKSIDSSLLDEWNNLDATPDEKPPVTRDTVVADRHGMEVLVRNAMFLRVRLASQRRADQLGKLDQAWGFGQLKWKQALNDFYDAHDAIRLDADAHSKAYFIVDTADEKTKHTWHVTQIFSDSDGDHDFKIAADVDLDATQTQGEVVFSSYNVGFPEQFDNES